jgi:hypothetical protein
MRDDMIFIIAVIDSRLDHCHPVTGDLSPTKASEQFLALAAVHRADDYL